MPPVRNGRWAEGFVDTERAISQQIGVYQKLMEQKSRQRQRRLGWVGEFLATICAVLFVQQWRKAYRTRRAEARTQADFQDAFRAWIEDELLKVNIQRLSDGGERLQSLHRRLEEAKHATSS